MRLTTKEITLCILFHIILAPTLFSQTTNLTSDGFYAPLQIPLRLSGNFGELRTNHFHSGIDLKTQGIKGQKVFAIANGYVFRVKVSANGYGRALYIHHPEKGVTSVYGHLETFSEQVESYVKRRQYNLETFEIQLFPEKDQFNVKKGDLIGYSGNSGSSKGPHLHFEIRKMGNQHPLNPLKYEFNIRDNVHPKIFNMGIYPRSNKSRINGQNNKKILEVVTSRKNHYEIQDEQPIKIHGPVGFGIKTFDFLNGAPNWCGVYSIKLYIDSTLWYHHEMDQFSFYETSYINSLIDYEEKIRNNSTIQKSFLQPHNNLSIYNFVRNDGIYHFTSDTIHHLKYEVTDVYGNLSVLEFQVHSSSVSTDPAEPNKKHFEKVMPYNQTNHFDQQDIKLDFPKYAFYDTVHFEYSKTATKGNDFYSDIHEVHNKYTPVHKDYTLSIKTKNLPDVLREKAFIAQVDKDDYVYSGGEMVNGFISTTADEFGKFVVMVDNEKPTITPFVFSAKKISFKIKDQISGIKSYNGFIDGEWVLFEYDPKRDLLTYKVDTNKLSKAKNHELELFISDQMNNIATYHDTFSTD